MKKAFKEGDRVEAQFGGDGGDYYPGTVSKVRTNRKQKYYRVEYDDGDVDEKLFVRHLRPLTEQSPNDFQGVEKMPPQWKKGDRVEAEFGGSGGQYYKATVDSVRKSQKGEVVYSVRYDDGDYDSRLFPENLKPLEILESTGTATTIIKEEQNHSKIVLEKKTVSQKSTEQPSLKVKQEEKVTSKIQAEQLPALSSQKVISVLKQNDNRVSSYELSRQLRIQQNKAVLAGLGLASASIQIGGSHLHSKTTSSSMVRRSAITKGIKTIPRKRAKREPTRRSLRQQGKGADGKQLPSDFKEPSAKGGYGRIMRGGSSSNYRDEPKLSISGNVELEEDGLSFLNSLKLRVEKATSAVAHVARQNVSAVDKASVNESNGNDSGKENENAEDNVDGVDSQMLKYAGKLARFSVDESSGIRKVALLRRYK